MRNEFCVNDAVVLLMIVGVFVPIVAKSMTALVALAIVVLQEDNVDLFQRGGLFGY